MQEHVQTVWKTDDYFKNGPHEYVHTYLHRLSGTIGMHACEFYELNIIIEGVCKHNIDGTWYDADCGSVYFITPGMEHGYAAERECAIFHALIKQDFFEQYTPELQKINGYMLLFEIDPYLRHASRTPLPVALDHNGYQIISPIMSMLLKNESRKAADAEALINISLLYLFAMVSTQLSAKCSTTMIGGKSNPNELQIIRSMEYIRMHVDQHLTIGTLAEQAHMARSTYMRNFVLVADCSPMEFLLQCRMAQARKLLCYSNLSVTAVGTECGFYDSSHFIRVFTKSEGFSPMNYRMLHQHSVQYSICTIC